ncbi:DNA glycosylase [Gallibacterium anatis]|uniref:DNA glycosylase n=1 Tax=Gallibacterium anatis TaxID=750 RepID=A0A0A2XGQ8_9PAST|nr:DNA glycosylase [Gallibacterium anatis]KGQ29375.1 DNA glycosylase [Gallibacterium anatis]KGQ31556.1 DNA glycosylase [Gallibacterium anatis]KGQ41460.1 DNA glycosylase [Gallibacterium anatis]
MTAQNIETHPLQPFLPPNATMLMLGSFPPPKARWKMNFYYPNFQNDMWRIYGTVFFNDKDYFLNSDKNAFNQAKIEQFLRAKGIAVFDSGYKIFRQQGNASDKFLQIIEPINLTEVLAKIPQCKVIMTAGEKATETLLSLLDEERVMLKNGENTSITIAQRQYQLYRLPSSSRAYPLALTKKAEIYRQFFADIGML